MLVLGMYARVFKRSRGQTFSYRGYISRTIYRYMCYANFVKLRAHACLNFRVFFINETYRCVAQLINNERFLDSASRPRVLIVHNIV